MRDHAIADREAKFRWGGRGVAIVGRLCMVGYFKQYTPDDPCTRPPWSWVKCGEGATWAEAFAAADAGEPPEGR